MNNTDDNKNMIYFLIASLALLFAYQTFIAGPQQKKAQEARAVAAAAASSSAVAAGLPVGTPTVTLTRDQALAAAPRIAIETPSLKGSLRLKGALIDDLYLTKYHTEVTPTSPLVELLTPAGAPHAYYVESGFFGQNIPNLPNADSVWTVASGDTLSVGKPVVLTYDNGAGLVFTRTYSIDANYMITQQDHVANAGAQAVTLQPYAGVTRLGIPAGHNQGNYVLEGTIATTSKDPASAKGGYHSVPKKYYKDMLKDKNPPKGTSVGGWFAITDKYWMTAVIPDQSRSVHYESNATATGPEPVFKTGYIDSAVSIAPGQIWTSSSRIFAGAKLNEQLKTYEKDLKLPLFDNALDWGSLNFITIPFYWLLTFMYKWIGNYGLAILAMTVVIKIIFYPLAHNAYESMTKMKQVQDRLKPKLDAIKKRFPDDPQKQQEATMALYQEEKVNPMAGLGGCLPMLLQLPVFICLVKVLQMSIELRHAPFFGWIKDLSAPDPLSIINLFGALPFTPADVPVIGGILAGPLHIGPVAILYGASMWLSQQMTPTTGVDPMQKRMLALMPLFMIFFFSQLAIGLMVYYFWNNILTILQQYSIMHRLKVENPIDTAIISLREHLAKKKAA